MTKREMRSKYAEHVMNARAAEAIARWNRREARKLENEVLKSLVKK